MEGQNTNYMLERNILRSILCVLVVVFLSVLLTLWTSKRLRERCCQNANIENDQRIDQNRSERTGTTSLEIMEISEEANARSRTMGDNSIDAQNAPLDNAEKLEAVTCSLSNDTSEESNDRIIPELTSQSSQTSYSTRQSQNNRVFRIK